MKYIALTIGPIYKTLSEAKKTRELWGGSYVFSYLMREIIKRFKARQFIVPYTQDESMFASGQGVGLFHDRFIFIAQEGDKARLESEVENVLSAFAKGSGVPLEFVKNYFQIHIVEQELAEGENPITGMTPYLDTAELFYQAGNYSENALRKMLKGNNTFLTKDAFGEKKSFPSLPEIALHDLILQQPELKTKINSSEDELDIYDDAGIDFKPYHKYYAIVHADGDSMSKVIESLESQADFQAFSKELFLFCKASAEKIAAFGGETIFAGGDDLLFFSPVISKRHTLFDLCHEISEDFNARFAKSGATLSFGVAIQYYKFPLYEALELSRELLFADAKQGKKNALAFRVTKHSGQSFKAVIPKHEKELYENFRLFSSNISGGEGMDNFLHSIHHKIELHKHLIAAIADDTEKLKHFFDNFFNESGHDAYREFFEQLIAFMYEAYKHNSKEDALLVVYATLRFIKFVQGDNV